MKIKHPLRLTFSTLLIIALSVCVIVSILKIINSSDYSVIQELKTEILSADRGNIYTHDYQLLAVTSLRYELRFDGALITNEKDLKELARNLSKIFNNKSKEDYFTEFKKAHKGSPVNKIWSEYNSSI